MNTTKLVSPVARWLHCYWQLESSLAVYQNTRKEPKEKTTPYNEKPSIKPGCPGYQNITGLGLSSLHVVRVKYRTLISHSLCTMMSLKHHVFAAGADPAGLGRLSAPTEGEPLPSLLASVCLLYCLSSARHDWLCVSK